MFLNTHTYYSLRYGVMNPEELLEEMKHRQVEVFALTDVNNTSACLNFVREAPQYGIRPVIGIDFRNGVDQKFVGLAQDNEGFYELNTFLSRHLHSGEPFCDLAPGFKHVYVIYPFDTFKNETLRKHEFLGVKPTDINKLRFSKWLNKKDRLVAMPTATFRSKRDFNAHRLLRAIDKNTILSKLSKQDEASEDDRLLSNEEFQAVYGPFEFLVHNAQELLEKCTIQFEFGDEYPHKNKQFYTSSEKGDRELIRDLAYKGLEYRYGKSVSKEIQDRLKTELDIIEQKGFVSYFLINWDILQYARNQGYFYVGRGSGANSIVAYLLRITDVDPIELDLYFERFINLYRKNPPDFDIDFSWKDRDDITRYIFETYPNSALLATYNTFQYRAVVRELGKVFGLPTHEIDVLSSGRFNINKIDRMSELVLKYSQLIKGFPSHLSVHASGILIPEKSINYYSGTFIPPKGYPTVQFSMLESEDVGLYKFDILSQRGLGKIKDALRIVEENHPQEKPIDIHDVKKFKEDEVVKDLLRNGQAIGCFYVESPAMRMLLKKLCVDHYLGLVAASSVIRPGVAKSGMMREYILRFRYKEKREEAHPTLLGIMPETYGVMVYQEDVIKVAHYFADLTLAEADVLRRGMSGKFRSREEFQRVRDKFFSNCDKKGHGKDLVADIWRQIESFAGYAFAKGHSASYAVESYQCLYLKAYYPLEFMVATINNFGGFYRVELYVHEARMNGAIIHAPCVNQSDGHTRIYGKDIYLGFVHLNSLEVTTINELLEERAQGGAFVSLEDFMDRMPITIEQISILIRIDAFRFTGINKRELLWKAHFRLGKQKQVVIRQQLFSTSYREFKVPELSRSEYEDAFDQIELLGFPLVDPFLLIDGAVESDLLTSHLEELLNETITILGYMVAIKNTSTSGGKKMNFGTFIDMEGHFFDTTHFPEVAAKYPFRGKGVYTVTGKVVEEFGFYSIEVANMLKTPIMEDPRYKDDGNSKYVQAGSIHQFV